MTPTATSIVNLYMLYWLLVMALKMEEYDDDEKKEIYILFISGLLVGKEQLGK